MNTKQKQNISQEIERMAAKTSQRRVANIIGISSATINHMINGQWQSITHSIWRLAESKLRIDSKWRTARTQNFEATQELLAAAQNNALSLAISNDAGCGKSHAYRAYAREHDNVFLIECANYWTKKEYVSRLLLAMGEKPTGTITQIVSTFIDLLNSQEQPLVIIDQFDKLRDPSLDLFMDMYNETHHRCGFILSGVKALEKRILNGVLYQKIGYSELFSRVGRKFIHFRPLSWEDVQAICVANGMVVSPEKISEIYNTCEGDIRRVRRSVEQYHLLKRKNDLVTA